MNRPVWDRLAELTKRANRSVSRLSEAETDEFIRLYQRTSTHLSYAQTNFNDPGLNLRLSQLVAAAGAVLYGTRPRTWRSFGRFFTATFPAALWRIKAFLAVSFVLTFLPAGAPRGGVGGAPRPPGRNGPPPPRGGRFGGGGDPP